MTQWLKMTWQHLYWLGLVSCVREECLLVSMRLGWSSNQDIGRDIAYLSSTVLMVLDRKSFLVSVEHNTAQSVPMFKIWTYCSSPWAYVEFFLHLMWCRSQPPSTTCMLCLGSGFSASSMFVRSFCIDLASSDLSTFRVEKSLNKEAGTAVISCRKYGRISSSSLCASAVHRVNRTDGSIRTICVSILMPGLRSSNVCIARDLFMVASLTDLPSILRCIASPTFSVSSQLMASPSRAVRPLARDRNWGTVPSKGSCSTNHYIIFLISLQSWLRLALPISTYCSLVWCCFPVSVDMASCTVAHSCIV